MKLKIAAALVAASVVVGIGAGAVARQVDRSAVKGDATPATTAPATSGENALVIEARDDRTGASWSPADPVDAHGRPIEIGDVVPGGIEPIMVGTPVDDALATGLIERDVSGEVCEGVRYRWTGDLEDGFDLQVRQDGTVASLGMFKDGAETEKGVSVGNTYGFLRKAYGDALSDPEVAGYSQTGAFVREGTRWIGFLFDEAADRLTAGSRITMVEVTEGSKPSVMRDGC